MKSSPASVPRRRTSQTASQGGSYQKVDKIHVDEQTLQTLSSQTLQNCWLLVSVFDNICQC